MVRVYKETKIIIEFDEESAMILREKLKNDYFESASDDSSEEIGLCFQIYKAIPKKAIPKKGKKK